MQIISYTCVTPVFELFLPFQARPCLVAFTNVVFVKDSDDQCLWLCLTEDARPLSYLRSSFHNDYILETTTWKKGTELSGDFLSSLICKTNWLLKD